VRDDKSQPIFNQVVLDPTLIKGVYNACDQWCMYCPVTARCLAFRCNPNLMSGREDIYRSLAERLQEGMAFLKRLSEAEGTPTPEIDEMLSEDLRAVTTAPPVDDPLERAGARYARLSDAYLRSRGDFPFSLQPRPAGPTPLEVLAWFHLLIAAKLYRAIVSSAEAARGDDDRRTDAVCSAKVALIGIDRSLEALSSMAAEEDDARLELLQAQLRRVRREAEARFPEARGFVREGLD
jgi:hypothetical protein